MLSTRQTRVLSLAAPLALILTACGDDGSASHRLPSDAGDAALDASVEDAGRDGTTADAGRDGTTADSGADSADSEEADVSSLPRSHVAARPLVQWVDPLIGTGGMGFAVGATYPGPQVPFGMVRPGPDTTALGGAAGFAHCSGYWYEDPRIRGFGHTRPHGMGIPDYGAVGLMPTVGMDASKTSWQGYQSLFSHDTEQASPGYYAVTLDDTGVRVELTATARVALHRYTFPPGSDAVVILDVGYAMADIDITDGRVEVDPVAGTLGGFSTFEGGYSGRFGGMAVYYAIRFSRPFESSGVWNDEVLEEGRTEGSGPASGAWVRFDTSADPVVEVAVGLSFVDEEHARANLAAEMPTLDFEGTRAATEARWEDVLGVAEIEGRDERDFRSFYTGLYHSLMMPTLAMDVDGSYRGLDQQVHQADGFAYHTDFSLWDTYRSLHPLLSMLYPQQQTELLKSLMAMGRDGGYMPRWPLGVGYTGGMVGDSAAIVFADSWRKGVRDFDLAEAYAIMRRTAMAPTPPGASFHGRSGLAAYLELGYVPLEAAGASVSETLEFAYDDYAMMVLAEALGEEADREAFAVRAGNWKNVYDPAVGFFVGRHEDGTFVADFDADDWPDYYAEGNAWQYLWLVPHDLPGLAAQLGGREVLLDRLDTFFDSSAALAYQPLVPAPYYWHGNEPDIHAPWVYSALGRPDGSARWVRWAIDRHYSDRPDGLAGNDDSGTLSAWYVLASAGVFPIPATDEVVIASPIFTRVVFHLAGGDFVIEAPDAGEDAIYVQRAWFDDLEIDDARLGFEDLAGSTLRLEMGSEPLDWGSTP